MPSQLKTVDPEADVVSNGGFSSVFGALAATLPCALLLPLPCTMHHHLTLIYLFFNTLFCCFPLPFFFTSCYWTAHMALKC